MGRFINADAYAATGQGLLGNNMFAYCNNNPVSFIDNNGAYPLEVEVTPEGITLSREEKRYLKIVTVTVYASVTYKGMDPMEIPGKDFDITVGYNSIDISTPDGTTLSFNYGQDSISPNSVTQTIIDNNIINIKTSYKLADGVSVELSGQVNDYTAMSMTVSVQTRGFAKFLYDTVSLSGGVPSWNGTQAYAKYYGASLCGGGWMRNITCNIM